MKGRVSYRGSIGGKPVMDAKRGITLHISAADTKAGANKNPGACAAALAAMKGIPNCTAARVHLGRAYIFDEKKKHWLRFKTPEALRSEIIAFDRGGQFEPGDYMLKPLAPSDLIPKKKKTFVSSDVNRSNGTTKTKNPRKLHVVKGVRERGANR
jgi:hypothetical protein